jgi:hypothetical protein
VSFQDKYQPTSVADWALFTLLAIAKNSAVTEHRLLELVVEFLAANARETSTGAALSAPLVYAIVNIVDDHLKQAAFARLGNCCSPKRKLFIFCVSYVS